MDESLKVFAKQLGKNAEKQPGWIYLLAAIYLALYAFGVPTQLDIAGWRLTVPKLSAEIWATLLALVLYQVGDALDKVTFKKRDKDGKWVDRFQPETLKDAIKAARNKFGVNDGIYDVSMKILEKAKQANFSVHFLNEMAKFFRSLIAPGLALAIVLSLKFTLPWTLLLLALALLCTYVLAVQVYPRFKNLHRINLYRAVVALPVEDQAKIDCQELGTVRMFFWEGTLLATAPKPKPAKIPQEWDQHLAVLRESLVVLPQLLKGVAPDRLRRAPAPGEWSAHVVVCHLVLNEMNTAMSLRLILTQDRPFLSEIEDDRCAERFAPLYPDTETALGVWRALREDNLRLCASVSPDDRDRVGQVPWNDKGVSFLGYVATRGRHDLNHIEQIRAALIG